MKILVIGSGGREHAICWKFAQSPHTTELFCAPGNAGISQVATCLKANLNDLDSLAALAEQHRIDLTFVGPEAPLVAGIAEVFAKHNLRIVAPSPKAAQLEGSKIFSKEFMARHGIPTARFTICDSAEAALRAAQDYQFPIVVKADGLAAGKGVRLADSQQEFAETIKAMMVDRVFGDAGRRVLLEECLVGREASLMIFTDGRDYKIIAPAQDYKRANDNDEGLNTGGMGSFSLPGLLDEATIAECERHIIKPTLAGLLAEANPFCGVLYIGLMLTKDGAKVIEYNARFGDPETQSIMVRLDSDLIEICEAIIDKRIGEIDIKWSNDASVCIVAASGGYPGDFEKGKVITGLAEAQAVEGVTVFHAGTAFNDNAEFVTSGGRVLGVTARAATLQEARARAYEATRKIHFERIHYRKDIAV
ncbi:MAG: phosphoribosylamine--glycine ligase [Acidobacteriota bacterium]